MDGDAAVLDVDGMTAFSGSDDISGVKEHRYAHGGGGRERGWGEGRREHSKAGGPDARAREHAQVAADIRKDGGCCILRDGAASGGGGGREWG